MSIEGDLAKMGESIWGNISGSAPSDPLGGAVHYLRNLDWNPASGLESPSTPAKKADTFKLPEKSGEVPTEYQEDTGTTEYPADPSYSPSQLGEPESSTLSDADYEKLQSQAASGNELAKQLIKAYHPEFETPQTFEKGLVEPYVAALQGLPAEESQISSEAQSSLPTLATDESQAQQIAQSVSGVAPQAPNAMTQSLNSLYSQTTAAAIAQSNAVEQSALTDLGKAAAISQATFPNQTLVQDLLSRYAYQVESPSYTPASANYPGLPLWLQELFTGATGVQIGGGSTTSNLGIPDITGLSSPNLASTSSPANAGGT
jgi:hypothetical protein